MAKRSLFILSLPRSLSSRVFHAASLALGLQQPVWTTDGEILNNDRFVLYAGPRWDESVKFTREEHGSQFHGISSFLRTVTVGSGFIYKDVVQPFVASACLKSQDLPVLKIYRRLEDVAYAMIMQRWFYPARAFPSENVVDSMLAGLSFAWRAIDEVPGETIEFDDLVSSDNCLNKALQALYPSEGFQAPSIRDPCFEQKKESVLRRRETPEYQRLIDRSRELGLHRP